MPIMKADGVQEDGCSRSHFHRSLPNSFHAQAEDVRSHSQDCLSAMTALCRSSALLSETFVAALQDTPFMELALISKQVSQDLASRTLNASEHIQEDGIAMVTRLLGQDSKEKTEEGVQVLARCFLLMLQTQCHFFRSAADVFSPLGRYEEVEDVLIGEQCELGLREACSSWIAASQATKTLRAGLFLTPTENQQLKDARQGQGHPADPKMSEVKQKLDVQSSVYKSALMELPRTEFILNGGFHLNPQCTSLIIQDCLGNKELNKLLNSQLNVVLNYALPSVASQSQQTNPEELRALLQSDLYDVSLQVEGFPCHRSQNNEDNFKAKLHAVEALVKDTSKQLGVTLEQEHIALGLLCETCPAVAEYQSKVAAQLLFGRADVVTIQPLDLDGNLQKYAQISSQEGAFIVEVPTVWKLQPCDLGRCNTGQETVCSLGTIEVVYMRQIEFDALLERRKPSLPTIQVKLCKEEHNTTSDPTSQECSEAIVDGTPGSPQSRSFRHTVGKLVSKFGLGSGPSSKSPSYEFYVDVTSGNQDTVQTNHGHENSVQSQARKELPAQHKGSNTSKREIVKTAESSEALPVVPQRPAMVSPTVTITSHPSPTEEKAPWNKNIIKGPVFKRKGFASDAEIQDVVDLLSGISRPHQVVSSHHLEVLSQAQRSSQNTTPTSSSSSSSTRSPVSQGWPSIPTDASSSVGASGSIDLNTAKYGNFNPTFQEADASDHLGEASSTNTVPCSWPNQNTNPQQGQALSGSEPLAARTTEQDIATMYDSCTTDEEFAKYVASNFLGKRTKGYAKDLNMVGDQWGYLDSQMNRTWPPTIEPPSESQSFAVQQDSGSSSDESGENGDTAFSMGLGLTGPNFVASVNRRRHSSGGEEVIRGRGFDPTGQAAMKYLEVAQMEPKSTKTWPPKVLWQRPISPCDCASLSPRPYPQHSQEQLLVHPPLTPQWSDPVMLRQPAMWPPTGGSTPVSPAGSLSRLVPSQPLPQGGVGGGAMSGVTGVQAGGVSRGHPKLDRKYAYSQY